MYLNLIQIAESFGVAEKIVEDWIRNESLPHTLDRGRLLFDRAQVATWAASRGLAAQAGFLAPATSALSHTGRLDTLLRAGGIWRDVPVAALPDILGKIILALPGATPPIRQLLSQRLRAKGGLTIAPVGGGFALPHPSSRVALGHDSGLVSIIFLREALALTEPAPDSVPVTRLIFFIAPSSRAHLDLLGKLSRVLGRGPLRDLLLRGADDGELFQAMDAADVPATIPAKREATP